MSFFGVFVLSASIGVTQFADASEERDALRALAKATYKQTNLDDRVKLLEKKYISPEMKKYGGWASLIIRVATEKRISAEWTF